MAHHRTLPLALALAALLSACDGGPSVDGGHDHDHDHGAEVHGQDERGFVFLDPQHAAHPNWADVGDLELGEVATATVRMRNVEKHPITIQSVLSGCSCTVPEIACITEQGERIEGDPDSTTAALVVPPGATVELAMKVDSRLSPARNKDKLVVVRLTTDDEHDPYVTIELRMKIVAAFQSVPPELDLHRIPRNGGGIGAIQIAAIGDSGRGLVDVLRAPPGVVSELVEQPAMGSTPVWSFGVRVDPPLALGYQEHIVLLRTTGPSREGEGKPYEVKLRFNVVEDVEVVPPRLLFLRDGALGREVARVELFARLPGQLLSLEQPTLSGSGVEGLAIEIEPAQPVVDGRSNRWRITLDPGPGKALGPIDGRLTVVTDDPTYPRFEIPVARK